MARGHGRILTSVWEDGDFLALDACNCHGAWHARRQHCVDWPCPGCDRICPREPGTTA